jgi:hypothetical protein
VVLRVELDEGRAGEVVQVHVHVVGSVPVATAVAGDDGIASRGLWWPARGARSGSQLID